MFKSWSILHFSPNFVNTTCKKCVSWFILIITFNYVLAGGILARLILLYSSSVHCYCISLCTMWSTCWSPWVNWSYASYYCAVDIFIIALYWLYYWSDLVYGVTFSFVCISPDVQPLLYLIYLPLWSCKYHLQNMRTTVSFDQNFSHILCRGYPTLLLCVILHLPLLSYLTFVPQLCALILLLLFMVHCIYLFIFLILVHHQFTETTQPTCTLWSLDDHLVFFLILCPILLCFGYRYLCSFYHWTDVGTPYYKFLYLTASHFFSFWCLNLALLIMFTFVFVKTTCKF